MKKIKRQTADLALNRAVQLLFFLLAPDIYATAFNGVKYLAIQIGNAAVIQCTPFVAVLITVLVYTILFGRFFCGYACAFGFLGDVMYDISEAAQKKLLGKVRTIPAGLRDVLMKLKYVILAGILGLCLTGLYGKVSRFDPWEVFASFRAMDFTIMGKTAGLLVLLAILVGMLLVRRFFCLFLCPMGAVFALMPVLPLFQMKRDPARCVGKCHQCEGRCPTGYFVSGGEDKVFLGRNEGAGECIQCNRCASGCPVSNAGPGNPKKIRGNEWYAILIKAALLLAAVKLVVQYVS